MAIAFFDLDRTLLDLNSGSAWIRYERAHGNLALVDLVRASGWLLRYHMGFADLDAALRLAISRLQGQTEASLTARTLDFYDRHIAHRVRPGALKALARHREAGDRIALLTTSSIYLSRPVGVDLGIDDLLCNRFGVDSSGRFTGQPIEPMCFGVGKLDHARALAEAHGVELTACSFYTDSIADLPVLEAVGRPVVVHPDPRLRRIARTRGWAEENWGVSEGAPRRRFGSGVGARP